MNINKYINSQEFVDNNSKRIPVCIVVDCSGSMERDDGTGKSRINRVNDGISLFYDGIKNNQKARRAVDILIISVGNEAKCIYDFSGVDKEPQKLKYLKEKNNLTAGIILALKKLDERKEIYKTANIDYYQPWLLIMSDGGLNVEFNKDLFKNQQAEVKKREKEGKLSVFPIYVQGKPVWDDNQGKYFPITPKTYNARKKLMENFSNNKERLIDVDLADSKSFENLFQFLHKSASSVASNKGIIYDTKYGNFKENKSTNMKDYVDIKYLKDNIKEGENDESIIEERNKNLEQELIEERKKIEEARKELSKKNSSFDAKNLKSKSQKSKYDILINDIKSFPIRRYEENKLFLLINIFKDDTVTIIKNDSNKVYNKKFDLEGKYEFTIENKDSTENIKVLKINDLNFSNKKISNIEDMPKEIKDIINSFTNWDTI